VVSVCIMEKIWIIGIGRFGWMAFQGLSRGKKARHFVLVDPSEENLLRCAAPNCSLEKGDGVTFLECNLNPGRGPGWIIPALPIHLAAEWLLARLGSERFCRVIPPPEIKFLLPNPKLGPEGNLYVSHADFMCPDDCAEPRDLCTVTGKRREQNMFEILRGLRFPPFQTLVLRSHQLGPGIGGYRPQHLFHLLEKVERSKGPYLVSTACRCHGVVTALERL